jgi:hypothetical protein
MRQVLAGDAPARVLDPDTPFPEADRHHASLNAVHDGIEHHVAQGPAHCPGIGQDSAPGRFAAGQGDPSLRRERAELGHDVAREVVELEGFCAQGQRPCFER